MSIRVMLVDDHQIVRDGISELLGRQSVIEVVGEASNGREALQVARECNPDVVVMDIGMRELNGIEGTRLLLAEFPNARVIALSMHADKRYISEMLGAGARGYLLKEGAFGELVDAIKTVVDGRVYLSQGISGAVIEDYVSRLSCPTAEVGAPAAGRGLSPREREVLQLVSEGASTKEIAARLHVSVKTVESHRRQIMDKLGVYNIAGLIKYALREGLTTLDE